MRELVLSLNLAVRFGLELGALAAAAYWGATLRAPVALRTVVAIALPAGIAVIWGLFISPKARIPTGRLGRAGLGLIVFLAAAALLASRDRRTLATLYAAVAVISSILVYFLPQGEPPDAP